MTTGFPGRSWRLRSTWPRRPICCGRSSALRTTEVGLRSDLTDEALAAIDDWEPQYQQTIRSPRPQGPAALLAALGVDTEEMADMPFGPEESENFENSMLDWLALDVGDPIELDQLDDDPLADEPFRWDGISDNVTARVHEVLAFSDRCCEEMLDLEYRTACRRVLARVASRKQRSSVARVVRKPLPQRWSGWSARPTTCSSSGPAVCRSGIS